MLHFATSILYRRSRTLGLRLYLSGKEIRCKHCSPPHHSCSPSTCCSSNDGRCWRFHSSPPVTLGSGDDARYVGPGRASNDMMNGRRFIYGLQRPLSSTSEDNGRAVVALPIEKPTVCPPSPFTTPSQRAKGCQCTEFEGCLS